MNACAVNHVDLTYVALITLYHRNYVSKRSSQLVQVLPVVPVDTRDPVVQVVVHPGAHDTTSVGVKLGKGLWICPQPGSYPSLGNEWYGTSSHSTNTAVARRDARNSGSLQTKRRPTGLLLLVTPSLAHRLANRGEPSPGLLATSRSPA
ncbi:hypothetical protein LshimejAT787_0200350 [Lyophyllum shimeji]|uniref:Uncharacterized protein n=1 Tax=Lyophyllum shimeji TaxID=47721 RepID=A0A9P3PEI2_LYOSH|nr:hypothetical protein LshimejAT787_0200350 [Lyophyllum shimeji]